MLPYTRQIGLPCSDFRKANSTLSWSFCAIRDLYEGSGQATFIKAGRSQRQIGGRNLRYVEVCDVGQAINR
jgi:hypothetical protein